MEAIRTLLSAPSPPLGGTTPSEQTVWSDSVETILSDLFAAQRRSVRPAWSDNKPERKRHWAAMGCAPCVLVPTLLTCGLTWDGSRTVPALGEQVAVEDDEGGFGVCMEQGAPVQQVAEIDCRAHVSALRAHYCCHW